ncbi:hypothetical protein ACHAW5_003936 [Stephanodiscus triporus]|uniref:Uncharacterized protein n=1 Tax=Stephanodiscus triporus TaxID=2934178 RepID=A0ABD3Q278_9STRA
MCGICIFGLCIPYPTLIPMLLFSFQWIMAQMAKAGLKVPGVVTTDSAAAKDTPEKPKHSIDNDICVDLWCFCKSLTLSGRKSSSSSVASITSSLSEGSDSESDDGEEADQPDHSKQQQKGQTRRKRQTRQLRTNSTPVMTFVHGELCMPCTEINRAIKIDA